MPGDPGKELFTVLLRKKIYCSESNKTFTIQASLQKWSSSSFSFFQLRSKENNNLWIQVSMEPSTRNLESGIARTSAPWVSYSTDKCVCTASTFPPWLISHLITTNVDDYLIYIHLFQQTWYPKVEHSDCFAPQHTLSRSFWACTWTVWMLTSWMKENQR